MVPAASPHGRPQKQQQLRAVQVQILPGMQAAALAAALTVASHAATAPSLAPAATSRPTAASAASLAPAAIAAALSSSASIVAALAFATPVASSLSHAGTTAIAAAPSTSLTVALATACTSPSIAAVPSTALTAHRRSSRLPIAAPATSTARSRGGGCDVRELRSRNRIQVFGCGPDCSSCDAL